MIVRTTRQVESRALLLALLVGCFAALAGAGSDAPNVSGIPNFSRVTETILRGGQPRAEGFQTLKELGVDLVVSFRGEGEGVIRERETLRSEGIQFVNIPWSGRGYPKPEQVNQFFALLDSNSDKRIFLHCKRGAERTGVMVALYRIARQGWTAEQAYREMKAHGFRSFWYRHLRDYVFSFARQAQAASATPALPAMQPQ